MNIGQEVKKKKKFHCYTMMDELIAIGHLSDSVNLKMSPILIALFHLKINLDQKFTYKAFDKLFSLSITY